MEDALSSAATKPARKNAAAAPKRLSKEDRRRQLLETALGIVRDEGTDALTLARVAEAAGVTKPIAYEHFETRAGLLIALCQDYEDRQTVRLRAALARRARSLGDIAKILSTAYVDTCMTEVPEIGAIRDALSGTEEMEKFRQSLREFLVEEFRRAFAPFVKLPGRKGTLIFVGILGACETLTGMAATNRAPRAEVVGAMTQIMVGALKTKAELVVSSS